ncbi:MAG: hypothetical protein M1118_01965 [Chloroflexi bacterium]|nr:hypothetical protein [Chloroflexota bacterium]
MNSTSTTGVDVRWTLLVYRVPSEPSNNRVSVWRDLKRLGALYLQQCVCVVPAFPQCEQGIEAVCTKIESLGGTYNLFSVTEVSPEELDRLLAGFRALSTKEYAEIIEECQTKFVKEIEFERFRENYTYEEAEEIREDLEKIRRWCQRVEERDWFDAGLRSQVAEELSRCEHLLEEFEQEVYRRAGDDPSMTGQLPHPPVPAGD